jgi:hypothetical protein
MKIMRRAFAIATMLAVFAVAAPMLAGACVVVEPEPYDNPYAGAWEATDDSVFLVSISAGSGSVYLYDFDDPERMLEVISNGLFSSITFYQDEGNWFARDLTVPEASSLALGSDPLFGLYFSDPDGLAWYPDYDLAEMAGAYLLYERNTGTGLLVHDAEPFTSDIPLPGAVLLLGSGLIGIVGMRRKLHLKDK